MVKTRQRITVARGVAQSVDVHVPSHSWKYADGTPCSELTRGSSNAVGAAAGESASEGEAGSGKDSQPMVEWVRTSHFYLKMPVNHGYNGKMRKRI